MRISIKKLDDLLAALSRLSRREKFMVAGLGICFAVFVVVMISMWISSRLDSLERSIESKTKDLLTIIELKDQFEMAKQAQERARQQIEKGKDIQLFGTLENLAKQLGVNIGDMQKRSPSIDTELAIMENKVEVNIPIITIDRLIEFLEQIEHRSETIAVRKVRIRNNFKDPTQLDVELSVSNFIPVEEKKATSPTEPNNGKK